MDANPQARLVALVTGAGSGIGRAVAITLSQRGFRVALVGRHRPPLEQTAARLQGESAVVLADVSRQDQACAMIDQCVARLGRLDVLVNNAGAAPLAPIEEHTPELIRGVFEVNTIGPATAMAHAWPIMRRQGGGRIVNVSSLSSVDPFTGLFAYAGSKAALNVLTKAASSEGREWSIRCFCVAPGCVETPMLRGLYAEEEVPRERALPPEAVARIIVACACGERDEDSGATILVPSP